MDKEMGQSIRIWIRRNHELQEVIKILTKDNMYLMKYRLQREIRNIAARFNILKNKKIIVSNTIYTTYPRAILRKDRRIVRELLYARKSVYQNLEIVKKFIINHLKTINKINEKI